MRATKRLLSTVCALLMTSQICAGSTVERMLLVPTTTIYPNQELDKQTLILRPFIYDPAGPSAYLENPQDALGQSPRFTLPANKPIPLSALGRTRHVSTGSAIEIIYTVEGLTITAQGQALHNASVGELVKVRNRETGSVISGTLLSDRQVRVSSP